MKNLILLGFLIVGVAKAAGPDCTFHYRFTNIPGDPIDNKISFAPGVGPTINNYGSTCNSAYSWSVSYGATGLSAISISFEAAPLTKVNNVPGTFATFQGTTITGTNPMTTTSGTSWSGVGYFPFIRLNVGTFTGTGAADIFIYGWISPSVFSLGGGGSGTSGVNTPNFTGIAKATNGSHDLSQATNPDFPTLNQNTTGNAATSTAFDHNPTDCSAGQFANAIDSGGNLACNTPAGGTSPLTTKGDLYTRSASADTRIGVGTDGQTLIADSAQVSGLRWGTASGLIYNGVLSGRPACDASHVGVAFITDAVIGQQENYCSNESGSFAWDQQNTHDTTLTNTSGTFGVNLSQFCQYTNTCDIASLWNLQAGIDLTKQASGTTPAAGKIHFYANNDDSLHYVTSDAVDHTFGGGGSFDAVTANQSTGQATAGSFAPVTLLFDTNINITTGSLHSTSSNTGNFVASQTGWWAGSCNVLTSDTSVTNISLQIVVNGTTIINGIQKTTGLTNGYGISLSYFYHLTSGDIVTCVTNSDTGYTTSSANGNGKTNMSFYLVHQ